MSNFMKKILYSAVCFIFCTILMGCSAREPLVTSDMNSFNNEVYDLTFFPQQPEFYAEKLQNKPLMTSDEAKRAYERFKDRYFKAWYSKASIQKKDIAYAYTRKNKGYAENLRPWANERWNLIVENANLNAFPSTAKKAITITETAVRELPTLSPRYTI